MELTIHDLTYNETRIAIGELTIEQAWNNIFNSYPEGTRIDTIFYGTNVVEAWVVSEDFGITSYILTY